MIRFIPLCEKLESITIFFIFYCIVIGCIWFVFPSSASAQSVTYYIDITLGSDTNTGQDSNHPWKTIKKINTTLFYPGDQILFKRGNTWPETLTLGKKSAGTPNAPIIISSYGEGNKPHISATKGIVLANKPYITIDGLMISNTQRALDIIESNGVTIKNSTILHSAGDGIYIKNSPGVIITDSTISHTGRHGIFFHSSSANARIDNGTAERNTLTDIGAYGITTIGISTAQPATGFSFHHNTISNVGDGIYLHWTNNSKIKNNTITGADTHKTSSAEGTGISLRSSSFNTISGNTISKTNVVGLTLWGNQHAPDGPSESNDIFENTIHTTIGTSYGISLTGMIKHPNTHIYRNTLYQVHTPIVGHNAHPEITVENNTISSSLPLDTTPPLDTPAPLSSASFEPQQPSSQPRSNDSTDVEQHARNLFQTIYHRMPDMNTIYDKNAIMIATYSLKPQPQNLAKERIALGYFIAIFKRLPHTTNDWDAVHVIAYSGAKR